MSTFKHQHHATLEKHTRDVNLTFTKKQCQDIVKMQILQLRADGESDVNIKEFFTRLLERNSTVEDAPLAVEELD